MSISVTVFVAVDFFLGFPNHKPLLSSAFGIYLFWYVNSKTFAETS